jgi:hypothetical protein
MDVGRKAEWTMSDTSNRKEHKEAVDRAQKSDLQPTAGKKGGEVPKQGHGPAVNKNPEHREGGGQDKPKKKSD